MALALRSEEPVLSQIKKLSPDSQVICQSSKTHAFIRVPHAFVAGGHGGLLPMRVLGGSDGRLRRSPGAKLKTGRQVPREGDQVPQTAQLWPKRNTQNWPGAHGDGNFAAALAEAG